MLLQRPCRFWLRRLYCSQCLHHLLVLVLLRALGESCQVFSFLAIFRLRLSAGRNLEEDDASWDELLVIWNFVIWNWLQRIGVVPLSEAPPVLGQRASKFHLFIVASLLGETSTENCTREREERTFYQFTGVKQ